MSDQSPLRQMEQNRGVFIAIIALAAAIIFCTVLLRSIGFGRICGGIIILGAGFVFLLANDKSKPGLVLLAGVLIFLFADDLLRAIGL